MPSPDEEDITGAIQAGANASQDAASNIPDLSHKKEADKAVSDFLQQDPAPSLTPQEEAKVKAKLDTDAQKKFEQELAAQAHAEQQQAAMADKQRQIEAEHNKKLLVKASNVVADKTQAAHNAIVSASTPGGIGTLLAIIIFFLWAAIPVNQQGMTRLELLFYVLTGRAELAIGGGTQTNQNYGGGSSGDFGGAAPPPGPKTGGYSGLSIHPGTSQYPTWTPSDEFGSM